MASESDSRAADLIELTSLRQRLEGSHDRLLQIALALAGVQGGLPLPVGMLIQGRVFRGALGTPEHFAAEGDKGVEILLDAFFADTEALREVLSGFFSREVESIRTAQAEQDAAFEQLGEGRLLRDLDRSSAMLAAAAIAPVTSFTLTQASFQTDTGWTAVGALRVRTAEVGAWWPLESEEGATITYGDPA